MGSVEAVILLTESDTVVRISLRSAKWSMSPKSPKPSAAGAMARAAGLRSGEPIEVIKPRLIAACPGGPEGLTPRSHRCGERGGEKSGIHFTALFRCWTCPAGSVRHGRRTRRSEMKAALLTGLRQVRIDNHRRAEDSP